jgi:ribosomal protein L11 methyltransferase
MAWSEVSLSVAREHADLAEWVLEEAGALAVTLEDAADDTLLERDAGATPLWPRVQLRGLFQAAVARERIHAALGAVPGAGRPDCIAWREVSDRDWERAWMDRFEPMRFGRRLWIVPGGMEIPADPANIEIHLDPGLAFGTGTHPTTALCLEWLDGQNLAGLTVVDYGCGSGILGVAAARLGAARVICVDNDPQALGATRENAVRNGVAGRVECFEPGGHGAVTAQVVLANILAEPLIELAPVLLGLLAPGGCLVLSGLLPEQAQAVATAYRPGLIEIETQTSGGWVRLHGLRAPAGTAT